MALCGVIAVLSASKDSISKYRVCTKYHIHKITFYGEEHVDGGITDTFYYTADGNIAYKDSGITSKQERKGNSIESKTFDKAGKLISSSFIVLNEQGLKIVWQSKLQRTLHSPINIFMTAVATD